jgi:hypothetical protein
MKIRYYLILTFFATISIFIGCGMDDSQLIESLDGEKLTTKRFEQAYQTALESLSRSQNIEKKNLLEIVAKDIDELDEQLKPLNYQFQKKNFYETYRNMLMVKIAADRAGFTSRSDIKDILKYLEMQTVAQLYISEEVEKKIKISDEDAIKECQRLRTEDQRYRSLPLERCTMLGRSSIKSNESQKALPKVLERIKEGISIKHNEKFDLEQFLKGEAELKKESSKAESKPEEKTGTGATTPANPPQK